jgi:hypothetical protein
MLIVGRRAAPKAAQILQRTNLASFAESYAFIHQELDVLEYRDVEVHLQELLVERSAGIARREKFDASEVRTLFKNGSPMLRALALGLMEGDSCLADGAASTTPAGYPRLSTRISHPTSCTSQR